eukprot:gnl/MRDRNA2_/MRDRNA2_119612_c0_seq1.p1 gnl/MRDRNA2_/MRDRNA2_119612_c0~~gnl/MRDRNA2_/MRDRNA2_119612_c0_seq1.p1  ORF type:complete len:773 (+),score=127.03 gnl/MRDRNA2_/MRDRNA2_119612_c0_seq1:83-2401(+)
MAGELSLKLSRRLQVCEAEGASFVKESARGTSDVAWDEHHEGQFTPRSRAQREAAKLAPKAMGPLPGTSALPKSSSPTHQVSTSSGSVASCASPVRSTTQSASASSSGIGSGGVVVPQSSNPTVFSPRPSGYMGGSMSLPVSRPVSALERSRVVPAHQPQSTVGPTLSGMNGSIPSKPQNSQVQRTLLAESAGPAKPQAQAPQAMPMGSLEVAWARGSPSSSSGASASMRPHDPKAAAMQTGPAIWKSQSPSVPSKLVAPESSKLQMSRSSDASQVARMASPQGGSVPSPQGGSVSLQPGEAARNQYLQPADHGRGGHLDFASLRLDDMQASMPPIDPYEMKATLPFNASMQTSESYADLWRAVVKGDVWSLEALWSQGILRSGDIKDPNGHTVVWNAVAFQHPEAALWLLKKFPPGQPGGADMSEVHERRKDTLLHLICHLENFTRLAAELFRICFRYSPPEIHEKRNATGQSFLHIAAVKLNFWVLQFSLAHASRLVPGLLWAEDHLGLTPIGAIQRHFAAVGGAKEDKDWACSVCSYLNNKLLAYCEACETPRKDTMPAARRVSIPHVVRQLPNWMELAGFRPTGAAEVPFSDLTLEVDDADRGLTVFQVHRVVVAANSQVFHEQLLQLPPDDEKLRVDSRFCGSGEIMGAALHFMYTGEVPHELQMHLWFPLLRFAVAYRLPDALVEYARASLVASLEDAAYRSQAPDVLRESRRLGLTETELQAAAAALLSVGSDAIQRLPNNECQVKALQVGLAELEKMLQAAARE